MDKTTFAAGMKALVDFYGEKHQPSKEALVMWFKKLTWVHAHDFEAAIDAITSAEKYFPTPQTVLKYADEARGRRSIREREQDKNQAQRFFDPGAYRAGIGRDSARFLNLLIDTPFKTKLEKLEFELNGYRKLHEKYPSAGFQEIYLETLVQLNQHKAELGSREMQPA